jgi:alpha-beta hydrolase superfamily lysophospholipase
MRYAIAFFILLIWLPFDVSAKDSASTAETKFVEVGGVKLGYREVGSGDPIIMFTRLRGTIDTWDPAFVDALANGYRVIMVDYPGVGYRS